MGCEGGDLDDRGSTRKPESGRRRNGLRAPFRRATDMSTLPTRYPRRVPKSVLCLLPWCQLIPDCSDVIRVVETPPIDGKTASSICQTLLLCIGFLPISVAPWITGT